MYTLLSGLYKYMFRKDEYCVLILGLDNAGKTVGGCPCPCTRVLGVSPFRSLVTAQKVSKPHLRPWDSRHQLL